jgi:hypothetical protein
MKKLFLTFITGTVLFFVSCSNPSGSSNETTAEETSENRSSGTIRVMAYNIHHANPPSRPDYIDIDSIVGVIRAQYPDIVALQEVDVNIPRSGSIDEAEEIATKLSMKV